MLTLEVYKGSHFISLYITTISLISLGMLTNLTKRLHQINHYKVINYYFSIVLTQIASYNAHLQCFKWNFISLKYSLFLAGNTHPIMGFKYLNAILILQSSVPPSRSWVNSYLESLLYTQPAGVERADSVGLKLLSIALCVFSSLLCLPFGKLT